MKKNILYIYIGIIFIIFFVSCKKVFDQQNIGAISPDEVWSNPDQIELFVNQLYQILPSWDRNEIYTEEGGGNADGIINSFLNGRQETTSGFPGGINWESAYGVIRNMNTFFEEIEDVPQSIMEKNKKDELEGQVRFLRAFVYYGLLQAYGGVPIINDVQNPLDTVTSMVTRNSSSDVFDFIVSDLDESIKLLPLEWDEKDEGRVNRIAAKVVKGKVLMLKASPLFVPNQNHPEFWQDAYNAYSEAMNDLDSRGYKLYTKGGDRAYTNMWYDKSGTEKSWILSVRFRYPDKSNFHQAGQRPLSVSGGDAGRAQPTWEMVQSYPMSNGKDISDPSSGYNEDKYWEGRDPRFYQTIVYPGAKYSFGNDKTRVQWMFPQLATDGYLNEFGTQTGFYCRKQIDTTLLAGDLSQQAFDWPILRYAEVLLDMAEIANEIDRPDLAKENLIKIRQRAGIESGTGNFGLSPNVGISYQATLEAIMKERQIEMAYEGKRISDLRRRRMLNVLNDYGTFHAGGSYLADPVGTAADTTGHNLRSISEILDFYNSLINNPPVGVSADSIISAVVRFKVELIDRSATNDIRIPDSYYFYPLNPSWIQKDPKLEQNIGWDNGSFNPTIQ